MPAARRLASAALGKQSCSDLFDPNHEGRLPATVLLDALTTEGGSLYGDIVFEPHSKGDVASIDGGGDSVHISINSLGTTGSRWNRGNTQENAITLLHELAHAFNRLSGAGGFKLREADDERDKNAFDNEIKKNCF